MDYKFYLLCQIKALWPVKRTQFSSQENKECSIKKSKEYGSGKMRVCRT